MTRYVMVVDLRRCTGCQTCTVACKHSNATPPGVQWRTVLDIESGEFPDVRRTFVPTGCQHCLYPPCMTVCPTTATRQRADGIVTINYDYCIGCGYCIVACPYDARFKVTNTRYAFNGQPTESEIKRYNPRQIGVATKCTFCVDRLDEAVARGLKPGVDPEATPACANSCIANALYFGDLEDPESRVSQLIRENSYFLMHEELGTQPGIYYLWDRNGAAPGTGHETPE